MRLSFRSLATAGVALSLMGAVPAACAAEIMNVVIVHGAFDGAGWRKVFEPRGYRVPILRHPPTSLEADLGAAP